MIRLGDSKDLRVSRALLTYRNCASRFGCHSPAIRLLKIQVHASDEVSPFFRLREKHAVDIQGRHVAVRVTHQDDIDTGNMLGYREGRVFIRHLPWERLTSS